MVTDVPDWAKTPELLEINKQLKQDLASESQLVKRTDVFLLTNKGWIHERLFGK